MRQREREVSHIVRSIKELNDIFHQVAHLVDGQAEVVDRIDYAVESSSIAVSKGRDQLRAAERYRRGSRKMCLICLMSVVTIVLLIVLVATKS